MNLRIFGRNAVVYAFGTIILRASSFLLIPLYTHHLSLEDYGLLSTLLLTIQILITIVDFGIRSGMMRFIAEYEKKKRIDEFLGSALLLNILGGVIVTLITLLVLKPIFMHVLHIERVMDFAVLTCMAAVFQSLCINVISFYRARNMGIMFMIVNLAAALLLISGTVIFLIRLNMGIQGILISQIVSYGALWVVITAIIIAKNGISVSKPTFLMLLKFGFPLIFAMGGNLLMNTTAVYFLGYFTSMAQVAVYSLAFKIASIAEMVVILPFQLAYEPFVFANLDSPGIKAVISKLTTYLLLAFAFVGFGIVFVFRDLMSLIAPPEYSPAYLYIFLFLPGIAAQGLHYVGQSLLHIKKRTHITGLTVSFFSLLSVVLNYFLIQQYGIYGLILVFNLTMIAIAVSLLVLGINSFSIKLEAGRLLIVGFVFVVLLVNVFTFRGISPVIYYPVLIAALLSIAAFLYYGKFLRTGEREFISGLFKSRHFYPVQKQQDA